MANELGELSVEELAAEPLAMAGLVVALREDAVDREAGLGAGGPPSDAAWRDKTTRRELSMRGDLNTLKAGQTAIRGEVAEVRGDVAEVRGEVAEVRGEVAEVRGEVAEVRGDVAEVRGEVAAIRGEVAEVRGEVGEIKGDVAEIRTGITMLLVANSQGVKITPEQLALWEQVPE